MKAILSLFRDNGYTAAVALNFTGIAIAISLNAASIISITLAILGIITSLVAIWRQSQLNKMEQKSVDLDKERIVNELASQSLATQDSNVLLNTTIKELRARIIVLEEHPQGDHPNA